MKTRVNIFSSHCTCIDVCKLNFEMYLDEQNSRSNLILNVQSPEFLMWLF